MNPESEISKVIDRTQFSETDYDNFLLNNKVSNIYKVNDDKDLITYTTTNLSEIKSTDLESRDVSVAVAFAVTSYARIEMSKYKTMENYNVYYSDTDSLAIDKPLPNYMIGSELGQMKLEHQFIEAVFLCPKVLGGTFKDKNDKISSIVKIKGLKDPLPFNEFKTLLKKDMKITINQDKWHRDISNSNIFLKKDTYTLMVTENKRNVIYDDNGVFKSTEPLILPFDN